MNTLKSIMVVAVLGVVGYGVYIALGNPPPESMDQLKDMAFSGDTSAPEVQPGEPVNPNELKLNSGLNISVGEPTTPGDPLGTSSPPSFDNPAASSGYSSIPNADEIPTENINHGVPSNEPKSRYGSLAENQGQSSNVPSVQRATATEPVSPNTATSSVGSRYNDLANNPAAAATESPAAARSSGENAMFRKALLNAQDQLQRGKLSEALLNLTPWHNDPRLSPAEHSELQGLLDQLAGTVIYSQEHLLGSSYRVKPGDRLEDIAAGHHVPVGLLAKINGLDRNAPLKSGSELKVVRGPFSAFINVEKKNLTLHLGGRYAGTFPIQCGAEVHENLGSFVVVSKTREHSGYSGQRWIEIGSGFGATASHRAKLGIVGTKDLKMASGRGTIEVTSKDADDLYDILSQGSKVTIRR